MLLSSHTILHTHPLHQSEARISTGKSVVRIDGQMSVLYVAFYFFGQVYHAEGQELSVLGPYDFQPGKQFIGVVCKGLGDGGVLYIILFRFAEDDEVSLLGFEGKDYFRLAVRTVPNREAFHGSRLCVP